MMEQLVLIERQGLFQYGGRLAGSRSALRLGDGEQFGSQLDKPPRAAATATAVAVENVFADIDVKRGLGFPMKGTQPPHLGLATHSATFPMEPIELLQQEILREPWLILAPGHLFCLLGIQ